MDYTNRFYNCRSKYNNACSEINRCVNRINDLRYQKQQKLNVINQLKTEIRNNQMAFDDMSRIVKSEETLNRSMMNIRNKTGTASSNFMTMVSASNITIKDLNTVYMDEAAQTSRNLTHILSSLNTKKNALQSKILELQNQLRRTESELNDIDSAIRNTESNMQDWKRTKNNAAIDMEYYRRKMLEE